MGTFQNFPLGNPGTDSGPDAEIIFQSWLWMTGGGIGIDFFFTFYNVTFLQVLYKRFDNPGNLLIPESVGVAPKNLIGYVPYCKVVLC